ncbi:hypothetical protein TIFTF001_021841 [Ficus carica]|uniref:Uncharacterized protein n=1 Tax=Ficus carica TaxID=3494 RepID=A0AA88AL19_FICCA|nr:hypothetical protein TIFTF001_021841 [Ficus carica]
MPISSLLDEGSRSRRQWRSVTTSRKGRRSLLLPTIATTRPLSSRDCKSRQQWQRCIFAMSSDKILKLLQIE